MTLKFEMFNYGFMHIKRKLGTQALQYLQKNPVLDLLMTSNDLKRPLMTFK